MVLDDGSIENLINILETKEATLLKSESLELVEIKPRQLPQQPKAFSDEDPVSCLARLAQENSHTVVSLYFAECHGYNYKSDLKTIFDQFIYCKQIPSEFLHILSLRQKNIDIALLSETLPKIQGRNPEQLANMRNLHLKFLTLEGNQAIRASKGIPFLYIPRYCPLCFKEDPIPYIRKNWRHPFYFICENHKTLLVAHCPKCYRAIKYWRSRKMNECYYCKAELTDTSPVKIETKHKKGLEYQKMLINLFNDQNNISKAVENLYDALIVQQLHKTGKFEFPVNKNLESLLHILDGACKRLLSRESLFKCPNCQRNLKNLSILKRHLNSVHKKKYPYQCPESNCDAVFKTKNVLDRHLRTVHSNRRPFKCPISDCDTAFKTKGDLDRHSRTVHSKKRPYKCSEPSCNKSFKTKDALNKHSQRMHSETRPYQCTESDCKATFKSKGELKSHQRVHNEVRPYQCTEPDCEATFKSEKELKLHHIVHSTVRPYQCTEPDCEATFKRKGELRRHTRTVHSAVRPYQCTEPDCEATFKSKGELKQHQTVHEDARPFKCPVPDCNAAFKRKGNLGLHQKVHSDARPYQCTEPDCEARFKRKGDLNSHTRSVHDISSSTAN